MFMRMYFKRHLLHNKFLVEHNVLQNKPKSPFDFRISLWTLYFRISHRTPCSSEYTSNIISSDPMYFSIYPPTAACASQYLHPLSIFLYFSRKSIVNRNVTNTMWHKHILVHTASSLSSSPSIRALFWQWQGDRGTGSIVVYWRERRITYRSMFYRTVCYM